MIVFDKKQKRSGFNVHGHYQFGTLTCLFCKSDNTNIHEGGYIECNDCSGKFYSYA